MIVPLQTGPSSAKPVTEQNKRVSVGAINTTNTEITADNALTGKNNQTLVFIYQLVLIRLALFNHLTLK
jgi:hypothetical protein